MQTMSDVKFTLQSFKKIMILIKFIITRYVGYLD